MKSAAEVARQVANDCLDDIRCHGTHSYMLEKRITAAIEQREREVRAECNARYVTDMTETLDDLIGWSDYADEYFRDKHDLAGDIQRIQGWIDEHKPTGGEDE